MNEIDEFIVSDWIGSVNRKRIHSSRSGWSGMDGNGRDPCGIIRGEWSNHHGVKRPLKGSQVELDGSCHLTWYCVHQCSRHAGEPTYSILADESTSRFAFYRSVDTERWCEHRWRSWNKSIQGKWQRKEKTHFRFAAAVAVRYPMTTRNIRL